MKIKEFELRNSNGIKISVLNYGGIVTSIFTPDRNGRFDNIVLGYPAPSDYLNTRNPSYFGAIIGRYANRIANARFAISGKEYPVTDNDGEHHLHGGTNGFDKVFWNVVPCRGSDWSGLTLQYLSKDGEEGFPGNLNVVANYRLSDTGSLTIEFSATTDRNTIVNLSHHSYFNLSGLLNPTINDHELQINADCFTPIVGGSIPNGDIEPVENTPFDFRKSTRIGHRLGLQSEQLDLANGFDHNLVLVGDEKALKLAAELFDPLSGRLLRISTTKPGLQFYSGNDLGNGGGIASQVGRAGLCLEPQYFPNSPNEPGFPSPFLGAGQMYYSKTEFKFLTGN